MESTTYQSWAQPSSTEHDIILARNQMYESVSHLSSSLRNAAAQCDNFIKIVARHNPKEAAAQLKGMPSELLALSGLPSAVPGTSSLNGSSASASPRKVKVPITPAPAAAAAPATATPADTPATPATASVGRKSMTKEQKAENRKERKAKKDPLAPKRPPSAYLLFQNEVRDEMRQRHPDLSYAEVLGKVSEAWKELGEDQKAIYQEKTLDAMTKWTEDKASYVATGGAAATPSDHNEEEELDDGDAEEAAAAAVAGGTLEQAFATPSTSNGTKRKSKETKMERSAKKEKKASRH